MCQRAFFKVKIIEKFEGSGRTNRLKMNPSITQMRKRIETDWIETLRIAYPNGFNDNVRDDHRKEKTELVGVKFPSLTKIHSRTRRIQYNYINKISGKEFLFKLNKRLISNLRKNVNFRGKKVCTSIASLNK